MNTIFELIKSERLRQGKSQQLVAYACHTSVAYISNLERGLVDPRWSTLSKVLKYLDVKLIPDGYLFTFNF